MQDPIVEFSQLCTTDDEILCLRYHQYQVCIHLLKIINNFIINKINLKSMSILKELAN